MKTNNSKSENQNRRRKIQKMISNF